MELNRTRSDDEAQANGLVVYYPPLKLRLGVNLVVVSVMAPVIGLLTAGCLWLLFLCANQLLVLVGWGWGNLILIQHETSWLPVAGAGVALLPFALLFTWFSVRAALHWLRRARRAPWLRLSSRGFEVNDRIFSAKRYDWREIDNFMLVAPAQDIEHAVLAPPKTYAEVITEGRTQLPVLRVGFRCSPGHRRKLGKVRFSGWRGEDGTRVDGLVMGYWDRPFYEAVDLMNEWLERYRGNHVPSGT